MPVWWKRLGFSFLSVILGGGLVGVITSLVSTLDDPRAKLDPGELIPFTCIVVIFSLTGWLAAIPFVLLVRDYSGWRVWLWGAAGISVGPGVLLAIGLYVSLTDPNFAGWSGESGFFVMSTAVSTLSTFSYLLLVLRPRGRRRATADPSLRSG